MIKDHQVILYRELGGIYKKGSRCGERLRGKDGGCQNLAHTCRNKVDEGYVLLFIMNMSLFFIMNQESES